MFFCHLQNSDFCYIILKLQSTGENSPEPFPTEFCVFVYFLLHYNQGPFITTGQNSLDPFPSELESFESCSVVLKLVQCFCLSVL